MKKTILILALLCLTISNAQKFKKIKGNGIITTVKRITSEYDKIIIEGSFEVKLIAGKEGNISIKGDENLLEFIKTDVNDGTLSVNFERGKNIQFNYKSSIEITIPFEKIEKLEFSGSGIVTTSDIINSDNFEVEASGSGSVNFEANATNLKIKRSGSGSVGVKGNTQNLEVTSNGSGSTDAFDLLSENVTANQSGSGSVRVNCNKSLSANSSGSGSIYYKGKPEKVDKHSSGSGGISKS
ncbi:head GIN domain-containing protein [Flavobacterium sp.]|uniref:head GIN domain-containing protein n=1 Tax=Flavobacterium sp. TaxID=239 RepID=UPI003753A6E3